MHGKIAYSPLVGQVISASPEYPAADSPTPHKMSNQSVNIITSKCHKSAIGANLYVSAGARTPFPIPDPTRHSAPLARRCSPLRRLDRRAT